MEKQQKPISLIERINQGASFKLEEVDQEIGRCYLQNDQKGIGDLLNSYVRFGSRQTPNLPKGRIVLSAARQLIDCALSIEMEENGIYGGPIAQFVQKSLGITQSRNN